MRPTPRTFFALQKIVIVTSSRPKGRSIRSEGSLADHFDGQDILDGHMGFRQVITKETILDPASKHYPPKEPEVNYFGFPETETLPYLRDLFT